jgi:hypothetical protein
MSQLSFELNRNGNGPKSQYVTHNRPTPATAYNPRSMDGSEVTMDGSGHLRNQTLTDESWILELPHY